MQSSKIKFLKDTLDRRWIVEKIEKTSSIKSQLQFTIILLHNKYYEMTSSLNIPMKKSAIRVIQIGNFQLLEFLLSSLGGSWMFWHKGLKPSWLKTSWRRIFSNFPHSLILKIFLRKVDLTFQLFTFSTLVYKDYNFILFLFDIWNELILFFRSKHILYLQHLWLFLHKKLYFTLFSLITFPIKHYLCHLFLQQRSLLYCVIAWEKLLSFQYRLLITFIAISWLRTSKEREKESS